MQKLQTTLAKLARHYGAQPLPPARGPFEHVLWENACYLLTDTRRAEVFAALQVATGLAPDRILSATDAQLLPIAARGGMRPETRLFRWREIARISLDQFQDDLDSILHLPLPQARKALRQFPNIGGPGADKILLFCGVDAGLPLESNGLRVLVRLGCARSQQDYGRMYRDVEANIASSLPNTVEDLQQATLLLRHHGQTLCRDKRPQCNECPLASHCDYALAQKNSFLRATFS